MAKETRQNPLTVKLGDCTVDIRGRDDGTYEIKERRTGHVFSGYKTLESAIKATRRSWIGWTVDTLVKDSEGDEVVV